MSDERQIDQVLARYVRAADNRDEAGMAAVFAGDATVEILHRVGGKHERLAVISGAEAIGTSVRLMTIHPKLGWSHHTTHDHLVEVDAEGASLDAQFVVFDVLGAERPPDGWPADATGLQGAIVPIESGYYRARLERSIGGWLVSAMRIFHDMPIATPGA